MTPGHDSLSQNHSLDAAPSVFARASKRFTRVSLHLGLHGIILNTGKTETYSIEITMLQMVTNKPLTQELIVHLKNAQKQLGKNPAGLNQAMLLFLRRTKLSCDRELLYLCQWCLGGNPNIRPPPTQVLASNNKHQDNSGR
jgi:hypothetical protein